MPLTALERQRIDAMLDGMTAGRVPGDTTGEHMLGLTKFIDAMDRWMAVLAPVIERAAAGAEEVTGDQQGPATDTPRRRGRKPSAGGGDGVAATAPTPGATAPTAPPPSAAQSVAQPAPAGNSPDLGGFAPDNTDPFDEPVKGNGADPLDIPENLRRTPTAKPAEANPPPQPTVQEVRDLIKKYMDKNGIPAANDMLMKIAKTKKFAEVDASKWGEIAATCRAAGV